MDLLEDDTTEGGSNADTKGADAKGDAKGGEISLDELRAKLAGEVAERAKLALEADRHRKANEELQAKLAAREAADKAAAEAEALKRGEHERLLTERAAELAKRDEELAATRAKLTAAEQREQARLEAVATSNEARIAALPEAFKAIVPIELKADPDKLAEWFARASAAGAFKVAAGVDVNTNPGKRAEPLTADEARLARVYQLDPDNADDVALFRNRYLPSFNKLKATPA